MISEERIILMTKAAIIENQNKREMHTNNYNRREFVISHFLKIWLLVSLVFIVFAAGIAYIYIEEYPREAQTADWLMLGINALVIYVFIVFVYALLVLIIYSVRYTRSQKKVRQYNTLIKQIEKLYTDEINMRPQVKPVQVVAKKAKKRNSERNKKGGSV